MKLYLREVGNSEPVLACGKGDGAAETMTSSFDIKSGAINYAMKIISSSAGVVNEVRFLSPQVPDEAIKSP